MMNKTQQTAKTKSITNQSGFSMIELLIVVAIIGILSAIAYPSYVKHMEKTRRADAQLSLLNAAQVMERCKATQYSYVGCEANVDTATTQDYYTIAVTPAATASTYTIVATPKGAQASDTDCPTMSLNQLSQQLPVDCWDN